MRSRAVLGCVTCHAMGCDGARWTVSPMHLCTDCHDK